MFKLAHRIFKGQLCAPGFEAAPGIRYLPAKLSCVLWMGRLSTGSETSPGRATFDVAPVLSSGSRHFGG